MAKREILYANHVLEHSKLVFLSCINISRVTGCFLHFLYFIQLSLALALCIHFDTEIYLHENATKYFHTFFALIFAQKHAAIHCIKRKYIQRIHQVATSKNVHWLETIKLHYTCCEFYWGILFSLSMDVIMKSWIY